MSEDRIERDRRGQRPSSLRLNRRVFIGGSLAAAGMLGGEPSLEASAAVASGTPLRERAARRGLTFGCMVRGQRLKEQPELAAAIVREAAMVVPGIEMKWGENQRKRGPADYAAADGIARFAQDNGLALRGHTALWYRNIPKWAAAEFHTPKADALMRARVKDIVGHFRRRVVEWDVVNEAIEPKDGRADFLRIAPFARDPSDAYIEDAFHVAKDADPSARLFYNDYGVEYDRRGSDDRRSGVLRLLTDLKRRDVPVHGLGIQAHLIAGFKFNERTFRDFLAEVAALGLHVSITELDVSDVLLPSDVHVRDREAADHMRAFLDVTLDEPAVKTIVCWGLSDAATWLNSFAPRRDDLAQRPLPLDAGFARKPMWHAMAAAFDAAPSRDA